MQHLGQRVDLQVYTTRAASEAEIVERVRQADIVITMRDRVVYTPSLLAQLRHLQLLSVCGTRLTHIDLDAATHYGILVCAPPVQAQGSITKTATAEQTWNLILGLMKDTTLNDHALRQGHWQTRPGRGLAGKTLGLLGLGAIGQQVAEIARAMRMRILAWSPHLTPERARTHGTECVSFQQLFTDSDIVSIHAPLLPNNHGLVGEAELHLMRPHALLINTAIQRVLR
jgi:phosphoglycerate dehydrogenase-like enzyme